MDKDEWILYLRREFAVSARKGVEWIPSTNGYEDAQRRYPTPRLKEQLAGRRDARELNRNLFGLDAFHRFLDSLEGIDQTEAMRVAIYFVTELHSLSLFLSNQIETDVIKDARRKYLRAKSDVKTAARILRMHAKVAGQDNHQVFIDAAQQIEKSPFYALDGDVQLLAIFIDFEMYGQQGDDRAYAIRRLDASLPDDISDRYSMIRDFLELIGIDATSALVRSTLLNGRT
jgi:hypothetical protein